MNRQLLLEYILDPDILFRASCLLLPERPSTMQRRRAMKNGAFSSLVKESNHYKRGPWKPSCVLYHPSVTAMRSSSATPTITPVRRIGTGYDCRRIQVHDTRTTIKGPTALSISSLTTVSSGKHRTSKVMSFNRVNTPTNIQKNKQTVLLWQRNNALQSWIGTGLPSPFTSSPHAIRGNLKNSDRTRGQGGFQSFVT